MMENVGNVTSLGAAFVALMAILMLRLPRRNALLPLLITVCYMPLGQYFSIAGLHFRFTRILLIVAFIRVWVRGEAEDFEFNTFDKLFMAWLAASLILGTLVRPSSDLFINRLSAFYDAAGVYFLARLLMRNFDEFVHVVRALAIILVPLAVSMAIEKIGHRNIFAIFGGVPEIAGERDGRLRCQGAFRNPILAGTFGASLFPLFVGLWLHSRADRKKAILGIASSVFIAFASASSGPLLAFGGALVGFCLWPLRMQMRTVRRCSMAAIVLFALVMKAPIWWAPAKIGEIVGGSGWHRAYLIDQAIKHFDEWWLLGTTSTAHWAPGGEVLAIDQNNMDITNHYVLEGINGGIVKLGLFLAILVQGFRKIGHSLREALGLSGKKPALVWAIGVSLWCHCISFISVSYFDQIIVIWFWFLAVISLLGVASQMHALEVQNLPKFQRLCTQSSFYQKK
jgi:hypothetical protein